MRYKTVIEIVSEADNVNDAADLAGEYLTGHLETGVTMKCSTRCHMDYIKPAFAAVSVLSILALVAAANHHEKKNMFAANNIGNAETTYAVHPPLKTGRIDGEFNGRWDEKIKSE